MTRRYARRLSVRRLRELELVEDAAAWNKLRYARWSASRCMVARIDQLLTELGQPPEEQAAATR